MTDGAWVCEVDSLRPRTRLARALVYVARTQARASRWVGRTLHALARRLDDRG